MGVLLWIVTVAVILVRKLFRAVPSRSSVQPPRTPAASSSITFETCSHRSLAPIDLMELANSPSRRNAVGLEPRKNIQQYASIAVLPYLGLTQPDWPEKFYMLSRRVLLKKYETNAVLAHMAKFDGFPQAALDFCAKHLPAIEVPNAEVRHVAEINVPAEGFAVPNMELPPINFRHRTETACRFLKWVIDYPLQTVSRMMHLVYPETFYFSMEPAPVPTPDRSNTDPHVFHTMHWRPYGDNKEVDDYKHGVDPSIAVIVLPPWAMSPVDLGYFLFCTEFPSAQRRESYTLSGSQGLWARIWDTCNTSKSRFFVFTTYEIWVFGIFSPDWTQAWTSEVVGLDATGPTVLECLFYWFATAIVDPDQSALPLPVD